MKNIKDMYTLEKFIENYYKNTQDPSEKSNRRFLKIIVRNMQISNCTVSKVKSIMNKLKNNDDKIEITDSDIIAFLGDEKNITLIQEQSNIGFAPTHKTVTKQYRSGYVISDTLPCR